MCGISGVISVNKISKNLKKSFLKSLNYLKYRGPDQTGFFEKDNLLIGNTRLNIVNLKNIKLPILYKDRYIISYNGEIINFRELKKKYFKYDKFLTNTDTEIIVAMYHKFKENCLQYFNGMFAIAIYDIKNKKLFLARDKYGIKPLYYSEDKNYFSFSSEINSVKYFNVDSKINSDVFDEFLVFGSIAGKSTFFKKIYKINPSTFMTIQIKGKKIYKKEKKFSVKNTKLNFGKKNINLNFAKLFSKVVKDWTNCDAKVGVFLSGGIDSSLILRYAPGRQKLKTFSFSYNNNDQEISGIKHVLKINKIKNINSKIYKFKIEDLYNLILKYSLFFNEPLHDLGNLSLLEICRKTSKISKKTKVILTGDGADELFAGYKRHFDFSKESNHRKLILANNFLSVSRLAKVKKNKNIQYLNSYRLKVFNKLKSSNILQTILNYDQTFFLESYLNRTDLCSMRYGIEIRPIFLDNRISQFSKKINKNYKLKIQKNVIFNKFILKKLSSNIYGKKFAFYNEKKYMSAPADFFFKKKKTIIFFNKYINQKSKISKYYKIKNIIELLNEHKNNIQDHSNFLTRILSLEIWLNSKKI
jgi:asparagine synthase (glutamine-hydrolysing)